MHLPRLFSRRHANEPRVEMQLRELGLLFLSDLLRSDRRIGRLLGVVTRLLIRTAESLGTDALCDHARDDVFQIRYRTVVRFGPQLRAGLVAIEESRDDLR